MKQYEWMIRFESGEEETGRLHSDSEDRVRNFITLNCPRDAQLVSVKEVD